MANQPVNLGCLITGCLPNQGNQGNQGKIREMRIDLQISGKKSGKSAKSGENQEKIREIR